MTAQRLEERLEAAADQAPQHRALGLDLADARRALHLLSRRDPDEADLDSPNRQFLRHARDARSASPGPASAELPARYRYRLDRPAQAISEQAGSAHGEAHPAAGQPARRDDELHRPPPRDRRGPAHADT